MADYCEVYWYEGGAFKERRSHASSKAYTIYDQTVKKFSTSEEKVIVILRHENHQHIKSWTNMVVDFKKRGWK